MKIYGLILVLVVACSGGDGPPQQIDAAEQNIDAAVDAASLPACTGATYEMCTDNAQCTSQQCRVFMQDGIQICTQNCDAQNPCPDFNGNPVLCNMMGRCKSPGQTMCTR